MSNILILSHVFPPATDGGSQFLFQLAKHLSKNHQVSILTSNSYSTDDFIKPHPKTISKTKNPLPKTKIYRLPTPKNIHYLLRFFRKILSGPQNPFLTGPIFSPLSVLKLIFKLKTQKPQIIISGPLPATMTIYGHLLSRFFSAKHIILPCFHTNDKNFYHPWLIKTLKKADLLLPFTNYEANFYQKKLKISSKKIYQYSGGIEKSFLSKKKTSFKKHLLFLGNHSAHKGIELLLRSYSNLFISTPNTPPLIIAGKTTLYTPQIKKTYHSLSPNIKKQISFITNFDSSQKKKLLDQAHFLILPSRHESFGLVLIEALARKTPFLVTNLPSTKELAKITKGGKTFKLDNSKDLQKKIQSLLKTPSLTQKMGQMGYNYVDKNLFWEIIISNFEEKCLKNLLNKK